MPTLLRSALLIVLLAPALALAQQDDVPNYAVTTSGNTLRTAVEFKQPVIGRAYVEVNGQRHEIENFATLHLDGETSAVVEGRRLARLIVDGPVRLYSRSISVSVPLATAPVANGVSVSLWTNSLLAKRIGYVQTEGGPVVEATDAALHDALSGNASSAQHLGRARRLRTAARVTTGIGAATVLVGTALSYWNGGVDGIPQYWPVMLGGAAVAVYGSQGLTAEARSARNEAIDAYNAE